MKRILSFIICMMAVNAASAQIVTSRSRSIVWDGTKDGWQINVEGALNNIASLGFGGDVVVTKKEHSGLIWGVGAGFEKMQLDVKDTSCDYGWNGYKLFGRLRYRFSDANVVPFVGGDAGLVILATGNGTEDVDKLSAYAWQHNDSRDFKNGDSGTGFFVEPNVGVSFRIGPSLFLDLTGGYRLCPCSAKLGDYECTSASGLTLKLGFAYTF